MVLQVPMALTARERGAGARQKVSEARRMPASWESGYPSQLPAYWESGYPQQLPAYCLAGGKPADRLRGRAALAAAPALHPGNLSRRLREPALFPARRFPFPFPAGRHVPPSFPAEKRAPPPSHKRQGSLPLPWRLNGGAQRAPALSAALRPRLSPGYLAYRLSPASLPGFRKAPPPESAPCR